MQNLSPEAAKAKIGADLGRSEWRHVHQELVSGFADLTGDRQYIHVDPEAARQTPFGGTVAHGFLTLALLASLTPAGSFELAGAKMSLNYGFDRVRFVQPVRVGQRIRTHHMLKNFEAREDGNFLATTEVAVEIEGESRPAIIAEWLVLHIM